MRLQKISKIKIFLLIVVLFFGIHSSASAQVRDSDISIFTSPEAPAPMSDVTVTISSFSLDLNKAQISWTLNGNPVLIGVGKKTFSFKVGDSGEVSTIDVLINVASAPSLTKRIIIQPGEIDLLWETIDSYVPPFYRGKALPASEARLKIVAMPNITTPGGEKLRDSDFTYTWKRNYDVDQGASGYGQRSFTFKNSYLEGVENISVSAKSVLGNNTAEGKTSVSFSNPKIVFYERDPFSGVKYNKVITDDFILKSKELQIVAIPYFFSAPPGSPDLKYSWSINNSPIETPATQNELAVRVEKETGGQAKIGLLLENLARVFQTAKTSILIDIK